jgi:DNA (cytosine-5)-methyltransferase 1
MQERLTRDSESSLLPTAAVAHIRNHDEPVEEYLARRDDYLEGRTTGMPGASLGVAVRLAQKGIDWKDDNRRLPTPTVSDQYTDNLKSSQQTEGSLHSVTLAQIVHRKDLLMTPVASEGIKAPSQQNSETKAKTGQVWLSNQAKDMEVTWGKFEPAIRLWEKVTGRKAPAATKPDGKGENHRLSSEFAEWMMGLESGWITDCGLTRNEELKAAGNGVVPQQAELALRILLAQTDFINDLE